MEGEPSSSAAPMPPIGIIKPASLMSLDMDASVANPGLTPK